MDLEKQGYNRSEQVSELMKIGNTLPSKIEDLAKFVLIGREQLNMVRAGIKALDKLDMAKDVREQKKDEAQMLAEALMDAEVRIGEILLAMPKASGKNNQYVQEKVKNDTAVDFHYEVNPKPPVQTKSEAIKSLGFDNKQAERFQTLAQHKDIVEQVKQEARSNDDLATRTAVLQAVRFKQVEEKATLLVERKDREVQEATEVKPEIKLYYVQEGQVWKLGRHTLICGNAYESDIKEATAIITDPPYGIDYQADWKKWDGRESDFKKVEGDLQEFDPRPFLNYPTVLLFGANYFTRHLPQGGWLCWDKRLKDELDDMVGSPFELAWFKSSATKRTSIMVRVLHGGVVNADSTQGNNQKRYHPTQKPVVLMEEILKKITREREVICDPFCGSGTTLIAAENTGRTCIAYEIDPLYCNIILSRFEKLTNEEPCLV